MLILWEIALPIKLQVNQIKWNLLRLLIQLKKYHKVSSLMETKKTPKEMYIYMCRKQTDQHRLI